MFSSISYYPFFRNHADENTAWEYKKLERKFHLDIPRDPRVLIQPFFAYVYVHCNIVKHPKLLCNKKHAGFQKLVTKISSLKDHQMQVLILTLGYFPKWKYLISFFFLNLADCWIKGTFLLGITAKLSRTMHSMMVLPTASINLAPMLLSKSKFRSKYRLFSLCSSSTL